VTVALFVVVGCGSTSDTKGKSTPDGGALTGSGGSATGSGGAPTGSGGAAGDTAARDTQVQRYAQLTCELQQRCFPGFLSYTQGSVTECEQRTVSVNTWITDLPGAAGEDATFWSGCADYWASATCDALLSVAPIPACTHRGTKGAADPCNANDECSTGFCKQSGWACGQCADLPAAGSTCTMDTDCAPGNWCMPSKKCEPPANLGESCSDQLYCAPELICYNGTCTKAPNKVNATCDSASGLRCDWWLGLYCSSGSCVQGTPVAAGGSCYSPNYCDKLGACQSGKCVAAAADNGGGCDLTNGPSCEWPALCVNGACQMPGPSLTCK
jgi:hypothetical protein